MNIQQRIISLIALTFLAITAIGGYALLQSRRSASSVRTLTEGIVPSALAASDLVAGIKDVQLTAVEMVSAVDQNLAEQSVAKLRKQASKVMDAVAAQGRQAESDAQRGLVQQTQESLDNYFKSIDETIALKLAGQKELAEATLFANVAEYQTELGSIVETLRVEKNRSKDIAISDLNDSLARDEKAVLLVLALAVVVLGAAGTLLYIQINRPIRRIQQGIATIRESLDLTHRIPVLAKNEMDQVAAGVNSLLDEFQGIVKGVQDAGNHVSGKSDELAHSVGQLLTAIEQQNEATSSMAASVEEMAVSVSHVSDSSTAAQEIAKTSLTEATDGATAIEESSREMVAMAKDVQATSQAMEELGRRSNEIGSIAVTIKAIAEQTNLLALNAAIEAARAGEQGRGFAVVADEVRKLAERTSNATQEIATVIRAIQAETHKAVEDMCRISNRVVSNADGARRAGESIVQIRDGSVRVVEVASDMAVALQEQSSATDQIARQIERVSAMSEKNMAEMVETREVSVELKGLSAEMHQLVVRFQA